MAFKQTVVHYRVGHYRATSVPDNGEHGPCMRGRASSCCSSQRPCERYCLLRPAAAEKTRTGWAGDGELSHVPQRTCAIDLARMAVTASPVRDECQNSRPTAEVDRKIRAGQ